MAKATRAARETRGRPLGQDAEQRRFGRMPATEAARKAGRHVSRLYRARDAGALPMVKVGTYWYVAAADLRSWMKARAA